LKSPSIFVCARQLCRSTDLPTTMLCPSSSHQSRAKLCLGADEEAVPRLRRSIEINRTFPLAHFFLVAALANLGKLDEAQAETRVGLTLDPTFAIQRFRAGQESDNPIFLAGKERIFEGMRKAGVPQG